jgi:hypothetical protein
MLPEFDKHPNREVILAPLVTKVAKLNVMFIGLAMHFAMLIFRQIQSIYTLAGGPSFVVEQFDPGKSDEVERISAFLQNQSLELVCQTVLQTAIQAVGPGATFIDTKPADWRHTRN